MPKKKKKKIPLPPYRLTLLYPREKKPPLRKAVHINPPDPRDGLPNYSVDHRDAVEAFDHFEDRFMKDREGIIKLKTLKNKRDAMAVEQYGVVGLNNQLLVVHKTNVEKAYEVVHDILLYDNCDDEAVWFLTRWYEPNAKLRFFSSDPY